MPPREFFVGTAKGTFVVALVLCLVCSAVVSIAAVSLKGIQEANQALDKRKNVLLAAGLAEKSSSAAEVNRVFDESIVRKFVDLDSGESFAPDSEALPIDADSYDPIKASNDPKTREEVKPDGALPGIQHREPYAEVFEIRKDGELDGFILPIYGKGLWSTLRGFLAVGSDGETVRGITYYSHAETPGLGGEVDNEGWKALWPGKKIYEESGEVGLSVLKGKAEGDDPYAVDGLSGATITTKGVDNMVKYWLGPEGFGKYLAKH